jgi:hypothetical protein
MLQGLLEKGHSQVKSGLLDFNDPADLPGLSALLNGPFGWSTADELYKRFGEAAIPYLERTLAGSPERFTAQLIARQLIAIGNPAGFQYAVRAIEQKGASRIDIIQILKSQFPELNSASEEAIVAFARARAGSAQ